MVLSCKGHLTVLSLALKFLGDQRGTSCSVTDEVWDLLVSRNSCFGDSEVRPVLGPIFYNVDNQQ